MDYNTKIMFESQLGYINNLIKEEMEKLENLSIVENGKAVRVQNEINNLIDMKNRIIERYNSMEKFENLRKIARI